MACRPAFKLRWSLVPCSFWTTRRPVVVNSLRISRRGPWSRYSKNTNNQYLFEPRGRSRGWSWGFGVSPRLVHDSSTDDPDDGSVICDARLVLAGGSARALILSSLPRFVTRSRQLDGSLLGLRLRRGTALVIHLPYIHFISSIIRWLRSWRKTNLRAQRRRFSRM